MMKGTSQFLAALALVALGACSSKPQKADPTPTETEAPTEAEAPATTRVIPPLEPLALMDEAPQAKKVASLEDTTEYSIGPIRLIHKRMEANPVVSARLYIAGGQLDLTEGTAGIEKLAMTVATTGGTESTPKDEFNAKLDATGAAVWSFADRDYSGYGLKTLAGDFDQNWELFEQAVLEPAMPEDEVEVRRQKHLAEIASLFESPDSQLSYVGAKYLFRGHPYHNLHIGTKENVESFQRDELLAFQRAMLNPERFVFVVVGNVAAEDVIEKIRDRFGKLQAKAYTQPELPPFGSEPGVVTEPRELPTNYILGYFPAPAPGHEDYPAMLVAMDYLRERLFEEVRTKRNLTYAVSSGISDKRSNYGYLYVTAAKPQETLPVMFDQVAALQKEPLSDEKLAQTVNVFLTNYYMDLETNGSQADMLAAAELVAGEWQLAETLLPKIRAVTPSDVQRVTKQYMNDYRFAVVGPAKELPAIPK